MPEPKQIPVAFCNTCKEKLPVVFKEIQLSEFEGLQDQKLEVIYCPQCGDVLNFNGDIKIEWYEPSEVHKVTNFRYVDNENN